MDKKKLVHEFEKKEDRIRALEEQVMYVERERKYNRLFWFTSGFGLFAFMDSFIRHFISLAQQAGL